MNNYGVDVGDYKTIIYSSRGRGTVICDEMGKRKIPTEIQLTVPRCYGNMVDNYDLDLKKISFRDNLNEFMSMFLGYLKSVIKSDRLSISVPYYFNEIEREKLIEIGRIADVEFESIVTDIVGTAAGYAVCNDKCPKEFVIIDFGHSKTTAGIFKFDKVLTPVKILGIPWGARNFDTKILKICLENILKEKMNSKDVLEVIRRYLDGEEMDSSDIIFSQVIDKVTKKINYIKTILNSKDEVVATVGVVNYTVRFKITKDEFENLISDDIKILNEFLLNLKNEMNSHFPEEENKEKIEIQVCGGNSIHYIVKNIMSEIFEEYSSKLNADEACSLGTSLVGALSSLINPSLEISIKDILKKPIYAKLGKEPVKIFDEHTLIPTNIITLKYKRKGPFTLQFLTEDENQELKLFSELNIQKNENLEDVKILLRIKKTGTLEILGVKTDQDLIFEYKKYGYSNEELLKIKNYCEEFYRRESEIQEIDRIRTETETMLINLKDKLNLFDKILNEDKRDSLIKIIEENSYLNSKENLNEEISRKNEIIESLTLITKEIQEDFDKKKQDYEENIILRLRKFIASNDSFFVPSIYKLKGMLYQFEKKMDLNFDLMNILDYYSIFEIENQLKNIIEYEEKVLKEIEGKKLEELREKLRQEEEKKKKEEEEKKKEEEGKKDNEENNENADDKGMSGDKKKQEEVDDDDKKKDDSENIKSDENEDDSENLKVDENDNKEKNKKDDNKKENEEMNENDINKDIVGDEDDEEPVPI